MTTFFQFATPVVTDTVYGVDISDAMVTIRLWQVINGVENAHVVDVDDATVTYDGTDSQLTYSLSQEDTGGFVPGSVSSQLNYVTAAGYRDAVNLEALFCVANARQEVLEYDDGSGDSEDEPDDGSEDDPGEGGGE